MATSVKIDATSLISGVKKLTIQFPKATHRGLVSVANEALRLSQIEVPHDTGALQNSGHVEETQDNDEVIVGYNKVYAARLHEHPEFRFQKGRKGKYLEEPIKINLGIFNNWLGEEVKRNINI